MNIYVGNLDYRVNENDLTRVFEAYGKVDSAKIVTDKFNGKSKGFGFVTMEDRNEAMKAIEKLDGSTYENRKIVVNEAKPKKTGNSRY
jgi:RNA recognition motif-containing protein